MKTPSTPPEIERVAAAQGLDRALALFPEEIANAAARARALATGVPRDLAPAEEPAHVYRPGTAK